MFFFVSLLTVIFLNSMPYTQNQVIKRNAIIHCQKRLLEYKKIFDSLFEARKYADQNQTPILDSDSVLKKIQKKVAELGCHIDEDAQEVRIFSVYPVKNLNTNKKILLEAILTLRPLNSKINFAYSIEKKYKVVNKEYAGIHSNINLVEDNP